MNDQLETVVRAALADRYEVPVVRRHGERLLVLGGRALDHARVAALDAGLDAQRIGELDVSELDWFSVPANGVQLWRQHGLFDDDGELVTELLDGDPPIQVIVDHDGWQLVRTVDGAMGWYRGMLDDGAARVDGAPSSSVGTAPFDLDGFAGACESFLGVPYRWGGTTSGGVDCSGLVQRAARIASGHWLPRHSSQLMKVGVRIAPKGAERGDILVLKRDPGTIDPDEAVRRVGERHPMHVAVAIAPDTVVHASRDAWRVVTESLGDVRSRYRVLSVRRLGGGD